ncbi:MAG: ROK family protein [Anaerolineaceae bacterium]|nr:ROK family protein [Anaerolineaceae bacterium]
MSSFQLIKPKWIPPLEEGFRPASLANRAFLAEVGEQATPLIFGLERENGKISRFETRVFPEGHPRAEANLFYAERLLKFLLWQRGTFRVYAGGPRSIGSYLAKVYAPIGARQFDSEFMGAQVYERPFQIIPCAPEEVPQALETGKPLGRHLEGCRIGFDLGASDRKASAVIDGKVVYSEEVIWEPRKQADPDYHFREIMASLQSAAAHMPRVDAVGGSSAGILIDNRPMVASLFLSVPKARFGEVHTLFQRIQKEMNVPVEVINDGDVTALAGSMSLEDNAILGIAMGSSQAAGYVDSAGNVMGWLSELAFAPVDYSPQAPIDEWSGELGVGSQYFSQQCVFRLAPKAGITIPAGITDAEKLAYVQQKLEAGHEGAQKIWQTMGICLGYALAHYADFYDIKHSLILGRCTSGSGGNIILAGANQVLRSEFPDLADGLHIQLPDERSRRVGQSIAAASLPIIT